MDIFGEFDYKYMTKHITNTLPVLILMMITQVVSSQDRPQFEAVPAAQLIHEHNSVVCYVGGEIEHSVPHESKSQEESLQRTSTGQGAVFEVEYFGFDNFPEARDAFQHAVDIWSDLIDSPQPIRVRAQFSPLDPGVLGSAIPSTFIRNFDNAPKLNTWYAIALAEKIADEPFNDSDEFDIETSFSSSANWYFDFNNPDGITGSSQTDFTTVVLHELGHGLGFLGISDVDANGVGTIGLSGFPMTFTTFVETSGGSSLITNIENGSDAMGNALTGGNLQFDAPTTVARVYAPSEFSAGSSLSHVDNIYNNTVNALMTPSIGTGGYIHQPGIALQVMNDYGWEHTYIKHQPLLDTEDFNQEFEIKAVVTSDVIAGFDTVSLTLRYSVDGFQNDDVSVQMVPTGNTDEYSATIPNLAQEAIWSYYIQVQDKAQDPRTFTNPGVVLINNKYETIPYQFVAAQDTIAPTIEHTPIDFVNESKNEETISASISDVFMGVDTAYVEYKINGADQPSFGLDRDPETFTIFEGILDLAAANSGDIINYRIVAVDSAAAENTTIDPETGFHEFFIESAADPITEYFNDFDTPSDDFLGEGFEITQPNNFFDGAIHSQHPYEEAGAENEINYVYQLKSPIVVHDVNTQVQFDEIVLVEPGEPGTAYGVTEFWDYVVVEASKDGGVTWFAIFDGYDSRAESSWEDKYNSSINGNNSTAVGEPSDFRKRTFDLLDNSSINAGDEILIRFRLFSDPFANGWGWAIDNLQIQGEIVSSLQEKLEEGIRIFPNPTDGQVQISGLLKEETSSMQIMVLDMMGRRQLVQKLSDRKQISAQIDLVSLPAGMYFISISVDGESKSFKVVKSR